MTAAVLMTWNLQGSKGVDFGAVSDAVRSQEVDVLVLQEVQRRQANRLAAHLGWSVEWAEKHAPRLVPAEGLAVLSSGRLDESSVLELRGGPRRSWTRRIAQVVRLTINDVPYVVANVHLSPDRDEQRLAEVETLLRFLAADPWGHGEPPIVAGDFNAQPPFAASERLTSDGWQDAWEAAPGLANTKGGATNWTPGSRKGRPPTQRLDVVLVPRTYSVLETWVPDDHEHWAGLSDHLPVRVTLAAQAVDHTSNSAPS